MYDNVWNTEIPTYKFMYYLSLWGGGVLRPRQPTMTRSQMKAYKGRNVDVIFFIRIWQKEWAAGLKI